MMHDVRRSRGWWGRCGRELRETCRRAACGLRWRGLRGAFARAAGAGVVLLLAVAWQDASAPARVPRPDIAMPPDLPAPDPTGLPRLDVAPRLRVDLSARPFQRDGVPSAEARIDGEGDARTVRLPVDGAGVRWSTTFDTEASGTSRLFLDWTPGPDGFLFEIVLDGERLPPPRDGYRPTERRLVSDLGPRWLGRGSHRIEFVCREKVEMGALRVHALRLTAPD